MQPLLDGEVYSAFSMTESGHRFRPQAVHDPAVRDGDEWVVNGTKFLVGNAERSRLPHRHVPHRHLAGRGPLQDDVDDHRPDGHAGHRDAHARPHARHAGRRQAALALRGPLPRRARPRREPARRGGRRLRHGPEAPRPRAASTTACAGWASAGARSTPCASARCPSRVHGSLLSEKQMVQDWIATSAASMARPACSRCTPPGRSTRRARSPPAPRSR